MAWQPGDGILFGMRFGLKDTGLQTEVVEQKEWSDIDQGGPGEIPPSVSLKDGYGLDFYRVWTLPNDV